MAVIVLASLVIAFIALSGLLAMVDAALLSVSRPEVEEMVAQKRWGSLPLRAVTSRITRGMVIVVIITNAINILGPIVIGQRAVGIYGQSVIGIITIILTFGTIVFSEIIPKSLGTNYAPLISRIAAPIILVLIYALYPLVLLLDYISSLFAVGERRIGTEGQIRSLVTIGRRAGHIESDEGHLIHRAFILNDKTAEDVMTPLKDMIKLDATVSIKNAGKQLFQHEFSRYPVFDKSMHEFAGLAMGRDILVALVEGRDEEPISTIVREGLLVPHDYRSDELMVLFRDKHIHLAVVQKNGKTIGLVTLEDVLEELVGEIDDEKDTA